MHATSARVTAEVGEPVEQLDDRPAGGDLVVEDDGALAGHVTDDRVDDDLVVGQSLLRAGGHGQTQQPGELGGGLGVAQVGGDHHRVLEVTAAEVVGQHADRGQVVDRHREEPVDLRGVQRHGQHPVHPGCHEHVGDQPATQRDPRGVLLVGAGIGVVGDDRGDLGGRGTPRRVDHEEQLHQVLLGRGHEGLHDVDVALAAVRQQLGLQAVVAEAFDLGGGQVHPERLTDATGQGAVRAPAEDHDVPQWHSWWVGGRTGWLLTDRTSGTSLTRRPALWRAGGIQVPAELADELGAVLGRGGDHPGDRHEPVRHPDVVGQPDRHPGNFQGLRVADPVITERVEVGGLDQRRRQAREVAEQRRQEGVPPGPTRSARRARGRPRCWPG